MNLSIYIKADADMNLSRADVDKYRMSSNIKRQQMDDSKNEYANQLQKTNELQVYSTIKSFIHTFIYSSFHPFLYSSLYSFIHSCFHPFIYSLIYSFNM